MLRREARQRGEALAGTLLFWYCKTLNIPINDPRVLDLTPEDINAIYYAYQFSDNPNAENYEDTEFDPENIEFDDWEDVSIDTL